MDILLNTNIKKSTTTELFRLKNKLKQQLESVHDTDLIDQIKQKLADIKKETDFRIENHRESKINEDGIAAANAGSVGGMGNIIASSPSSIPGNTSGSSVGSGDFGFGLGTEAKPTERINVAKTTKKKNKSSDYMTNIVYTKSPVKIMNYDSFLKSGLSTPKTVKENVEEEHNDDIIMLKVRMVIMSHLSDVQGGFLLKEEANIRINFVKYLLMKYPDTNKEIDPDGEFDQFNTKHH
jgi:hypothetical protein